MLALVRTQGLRADVDEAASQARMLQAQQGRPDGRGDRIRTSGLYVPNLARSQAKLHPTTVCSDPGAPLKQKRGYFYQGLAAPAAPQAAPHAVQRPTSGSAPLRLLIKLHWLRLLRLPCGTASPEAPITACAPCAACSPGHCRGKPGHKECGLNKSRTTLPARHRYRYRLAVGPPRFDRPALQRRPAKACHRHRVGAKRSLFGLGLPHSRA
jgi:hypothetical protein